MSTDKKANNFTAEMAMKILDKHPNNPGYAAHCIVDILEILPPGSISEEEEKTIRRLIADILAQETEYTLEAFGDAALRREILDYYVPKQLVKSINCFAI